MLTGLEPKYLTLGELEGLKGHTLAIDVETTGLQWWSDKLIGVGIWCPQSDICGYIPTLSDEERIQTKEALKRYILPESIVIAHNAKFDLHFLDTNPRELGWSIIDTTVPVHLLDSRNYKNAEAVEKQLLGTESKKEYVSMAPTKLKNKIWEWPLELTAAYCINDVRIEYEFARILMPWIEAEGLLDLFTKEMVYLNLIWEIERLGVLTDPDFISHAEKMLRVHQEDLENQLLDAVGYDFNWRSHKQLSKALYDDMGIERPENPFTVSRFNRDKGKYNSTMTSTFILMEKAKHPLGELVSVLRETAKLINYLTRWQKSVDSDNVLHTSFNLTGTRTGRLSSSKPNLQNIPSEFRGHFTQAVFSGTVEREEEYNLRNAIIARPGHKFVAVDYKQMEMRMFGILSGDPFMLDSLNAGRDVHADIAEAVWGVRDKVHREWAKTISFGLIYGMSKGSLKFKLDISWEQANKITDDYWTTFPRIKPWLYGTADECRQKGYSTYWSGRRWLEDDDEFFFKSANAQIQGGCADLLSVAALRTDQYFKKELPEVRLINLVHDELIAEAPDELIHKTRKEMARIMRVEDLFGVPWLTDAKIGPSYGNMTPLVEESYEEEITVLE